MSTLRQQVMNGIAWQGSGRFAERGIRFAANILLARLLVPDDFGALAALLFPIAIIDSICYFATGPVIIHSQSGETNRFLRTVLAINNLRGLLLTLLLLALSPLFTAYFENPDLLPLFLVASLQPALSGLESPRVHVLARRMRFGRIATYRVIASLIGSGVAVLFALSTPSVWALVIGQISGVLGSTIMTWIIAPMAFRWSFDRESIRVIRTYALRAVGTPALIMLVAQAPPLLLGRSGALGELGIFSMNARLAEFPVYVTLTVAGAVLIPAYSSLQDDQERLHRAWIRAWTGVTLLAAPTAILLAWMGDALPTVVWGERYASSRPLMPILALNGLLSCLLAVTGPLFWGVGRPSIDRLMQGVRVLLLFIVGFLLVGPMESIGVAWALTCGLCAALAVAIPNALAIVGATTGRLAVATAPALLAGVLVTIPLVGIDLTTNLNDVWRVVIGVSLAVVCGAFIGTRLLRSSDKRKGNGLAA